MGRFINADAYTSTGQGLLGNNMFAYCGNNPVMYCDDTGFLITEAAFFSTVILIIKCTAVVTVSSLFARLVVETIDSLLDYSYIPFSTPSVHEATVDTAEHTKNKSEKNRNKHEEGNARRQRDQGGEKKKQKKNWVPRNGGKIKNNGCRIY